MFGTLGGCRTRVKRGTAWLCAASMFPKQPPPHKKGAHGSPRWSEPAGHATPPRARPSDGGVPSQLGGPSFFALPLDLTVVRARLSLLQRAPQRAPSAAPLPHLSHACPLPSSPSAPSPYPITFPRVHLFLTSSARPSLSATPSSHPSPATRRVTTTTMQLLLTCIVLLAAAPLVHGEEGVGGVVWCWWCPTHRPPSAVASLQRR